MADGQLPFSSVFITGATGFVGKYLVEALTSRLPVGAKMDLARLGEAGPIDLLDSEALGVAVAAAKPDLVFHLAAQSSVGSSVSEAADTWRVNVCGTLNLAQAVASEAPNALFVFASSSEVYGETFNYKIVQENAALAPLSVYARSKRAAEDVLRDVLAPGNRLIIFRPTNHSGPGQDARFVLPAFAQQIAEIEAGRRSPVIKVGSLDAERDFLDVRDVIQAYLDIVSVPATDRVEVFNVASGHLVPVRHLLDKLCDMANVAVSVEPDPARMRASDLPRAAVDSSRLRERIDWSPRIVLDDTIADVLNYCRRKCA